MSPMHVTIIDRRDELDALADRWAEVYEADEEAHVFASWAWFRGLLETPPRSWAVLVVRRDGCPVAFWPIETRTSRWLSVPLLREMHHGGGGIADYCGLACHPEHRPEVVSALAAFLTRWDRLLLRDVRDGRVEQLISQLEGNGYVRRIVGEVTCRVVELPGSWDELLEQLNAKVRRNLRRSLRELDAAAVEIKPVDAAGLDEALGELLTLWQRRFGDVGPEYRRRLYATFASCHRAGRACLTVVRRRGAVVAGVARFLDRAKQVAYELMNSFDPDFRDVHSPGQVAVALSLRHAIEQGCRRYDFLRGDEKYKQDLGGKEHSCRSIEITKRSLKNRVIAGARSLRGRTAAP